MPCHLRLLLALTVSQIFPVFDHLDNLRIAGQIFCRSLRSDRFAIFSHDRPGDMGFGEEGCSGKGPFSPHPIRGLHCQCDLSPLMLTSIAWLRKCLLHVSTTELTLSS